jgi:putative flippase GtrA
MDSGRRMLDIATRHATVGVACAVLNVLIIYIGTEILHIYYIFAMLLTCFITIPVAYLLHRRISFRISEEPNLREFSRFISQQLVQFLAGLALLSVGVEKLQLNPTFAMVVVTFLLWAFALISQWKFVFRKYGSSRRDYF